jgi:hypothetical protein
MSLLTRFRSRITTETQFTIAKNQLPRLVEVDDDIKILYSTMIDDVHREKLQVKQDATKAKS